MVLASLSGPRNTEEIAGLVMEGITKPYRRTARPFMNGNYPWGPGSYICHPRFAQEPEMYVRGFRLLQKDLEHLFEYIEPSDDNLQCYSFRVYELLLRACVEVEANCKAILRENGYPENKWWKMGDYIKIDISHHLSAFEVKLPHWHGEQRIRQPFEPWASGKKLGWYQAYNATKHDRRQGFKGATLEHAIDAVCGVLVLLSAQFATEDFSLTSTLVGDKPAEDFEYAIGGYFVVRYPTNWAPAERYAFFDWDALQTEEDPFENFPYPAGALSPAPSD
jgi:hypothetical protein